MGELALYCYVGRANSVCGYRYGQRGSPGCGQCGGVCCGGAAMGGSLWGESAPAGATAVGSRRGTAAAGSWRRVRGAGV